MTPQGWIKDTLNRWPAGHHVAEGATHLAAALEEIAKLKEKAEMWESLAKEWLHEIHRKPKLNDVRKLNAHVRVPGCVHLEHAKLGEYWIDLDMMADRIKVTDGLEIVPAEEIARLRADASAASPSCDRCQSAHCCSVTGSAVPPLCVTDPDGSLPMWMPWTNTDVQARVDPLHAEIDRLRAEAGRVVVLERAAWLTIDEMSDAVLEKCGIPKDYANEIAKAIADASIAKGTHSVPSSRVLKDGEVAVDAEEWAAMCDLGFDPEPCRLDHHGCCQEHNWFGEKPCPTAILQRLYALRTQATATELGKAREVEG